MKKETHTKNTKEGNFLLKNYRKKHSVNSQSKNKKEFTTSNALIAVVTALVIVAGVQAFQTQKLLTAVSSGAIKANAQTQGSSIGLPSQVGGCG